MTFALRGYALWGVLALNLFLAIAGVIGCLALNILDQLVVVALTPAIAIAGTLILARQPANTIGRLLLFCGTVFSVGNAADIYTRYAYEETALPAMRWIAWIASASFPVGLVTLVPFLLLLFPTGQLLSPRWRFVALAVIVETITLVIAVGLRPGTFENYADYPELHNPLGITALEDVVFGIAIFGLILAPVVVFGPLAASVVRIQRAVGVERQQLKWFGYAVGMMTACFVVLEVGVIVWGDQQWIDMLFNLFIVIVIVGLPGAILIAITRHQLFGIDSLIQRTIVHGLLTLSLAATYVLLVVALQNLLDPLTQGQDLAIAASTLTVAALFRPLRGRFQASVDRRFYRRKYDAGRMVDAFASRMRAQTDLDAVAEELRTVVHDTMQPRFVSLWVRDPPAGARLDTRTG